MMVGLSLVYSTAGLSQTGFACRFCNEHVSLDRYAEALLYPDDSPLNPCSATPMSGRERE